MIDFSTIRTLLFDVDGVLYRGKTILPGVAEMLAFCEQNNITYACITNNGALTPQQYEQKLSGMGIFIPAACIITSALVTERYMRATYPQGTTIYAIGMSGLHDLIFADDYFIPQEQAPKVVVQGPDFAVTYQKLKTGCLAIRAGAHYIATNADRTLPTEEGLIPDAGSFIAALKAATDVEPVVVGKPQPTMFRVAIELLGGTPETTVVIGDRLETDIAGAHNSGLRSILVLTGVSQPNDIDTSPYKPDAVFADLPAVLEALQQAL